MSRSKFGWSVVCLSPIIIAFAPGERSLRRGVAASSHAPRRGINAELLVHPGDAVQVGLEHQRGRGSSPLRLFRSTSCRSTRRPPKRISRHPASHGRAPGSGAASASSCPLLTVPGIHRASYPRRCSFARSSGSRPPPGTGARAHRPVHRGRASERPLPERDDEHSYEPAMGCVRRFWFALAEDELTSSWHFLAARGVVDRASGRGTKQPCRTSRPSIRGRLPSDSVGHRTTGWPHRRWC